MTAKTAKADKWESTMSPAEACALIDAAQIEFDKGNEDAGNAIIEKAPLMPEIAMCLATGVGFGPRTLKESGMNLADADKKFGHDWLDRLIAAEEKYKYRWLERIAAAKKEYGHDWLKHL